MNWFDGSIPDAINEAKRRSLVFVVVITGDDVQSSELLSTWDDPRVSESAQECVAIKLHSNSEACGQFSQIYPVVCVPSSFFIGDSGIPLEVIAGSVSAEDLVLKINSVKQMHQTQTAGGAFPSQTAGGAVPPQAAGGAVPSQTAGGAVPPQTQTQREVTTVTEVTEVTAAASQTQTQESTSSSSSVQSEASKQETTRGTSAEDKTPQKKNNNPEDESKTESDRRKLGKDLQEFKRKQEEDQTRRLLEERQKEKEEERAARERVRQQIAMDRAERAARYARNVQEENAAKEARIQAAQQEQEAKREAAVRQRSTVARLQFRLPDGSSITSQFPAQSRLREARDFAQQEVGGVYGSFTLATMFPRREFTNEDLERTLTELELAPSASIVLLPACKSSSALSPSSSSLWSFLGTLFYPLLAVWRMLSSLVFGSSPTEPSPRNSTGSTSETSQRESVTKQSLEKRPKNFKKEGKICRLRTQEDSEDENNTWNGNSTQQM